MRKLLAALAFLGLLIWQGAPPVLAGAQKQAGITRAQTGEKTTRKPAKRPRHSRKKQKPAAESPQGSSTEQAQSR